MFQTRLFDMYHNSLILISAVARNKNTKVDTNIYVSTLLQELPSDQSGDKDKELEEEEDLSADEEDDVSHEDEEIDVGQEVK